MNTMVQDSALSLSDYDISAERGFLSSFNAADIRLPHYLDAIREAAMNLPAILTTGKVRSRLASLPFVDLTDFVEKASPEQHRVAFVHYSFLVQSYVWGEAEAPTSIPKCLAVPMHQLAEAVGQKPLLTYSSYVLDNWGLLDVDGAIDLSNIYMIQPFQSGQDEAWFVTVHVAIEARAGAMLAEIPHLVAAASAGDTARVHQGLAHISEVWDDINAIFDRMPERCDPYVYYNRVRPWIHGWKNNPALPDGLIYEGVSDEALTFRGQTGSQSSIVPTMDAFFGITHASDPLRVYLEELHEYRPPSHRAFIDAVRKESNLRGFIVASDNAELASLYNDCISKLAQFRTKHLEYAASYINKQAKSADGNDTDVGTGGTPFMKYLKKHRDEVQEQLLASKI